MTIQCQWVSLLSFVSSDQYHGKSKKSSFSSFLLLLAVALLFICLPLVARISYFICYFVVPSRKWKSIHRRLFYYSSDETRSRGAVRGEKEIKNQSYHRPTIIIPLQLFMCNFGWTSEISFETYSTSPPSPWSRSPTNLSNPHDKLNCHIKILLLPPPFFGYPKGVC